MQKSNSQVQVGTIHGVSVDFEVLRGWLEVSFQTVSVQFSLRYVKNTFGDAASLAADASQ